MRITFVDTNKQIKIFRVEEISSESQQEIESEMSIFPLYSKNDLGIISLSSIRRHDRFLFSATDR